MKNQKKKTLFEKNPKLTIFIVLISLCFILLLLFETYLQITVSDESYLEKDRYPYNRELNSKDYKRRFLEQYKKENLFSLSLKDDSKGSFLKQTKDIGRELKKFDHDPFLGWDHNISGGRVRGLQISDTFQFDNKSLYKIITIGNSFTYGAEVKSNETYPFFLQKNLSDSKKTQVLNMGVGGYGIDQAIYKYLKYGEEKEPNYLIFGILFANYGRTRRSFFSYYKPFYYLVNNEIVLDTFVIPPPDSGYNLLKREIKPYGIYSIPFLKSRIYYYYWKFINHNKRSKYYEEMDEIISQLLIKLIASLKKTNTKLYVILISNGNSFKDEKSLTNATQNLEAIHTTKIIKQLGINYINLLEEFPNNYTLEEIYNDFYIHRPDNSIGHFSVKGNEIVSKMILNKIIEGKD